MSQNEQDEVGDVETEVATEVEDVEEDNTTSDDDVTIEQALAWKKSLEKANKKIVALEKEKKSEKVEANDSMPKTEAEYEVWSERRDFYKANSQAKELRDEIEAMVTASKWKVDRSKAFELLSWDTEIEENRKVYAKATLAGGKSDTVWFSPISTAQYDKLSDAQRDSYNEKSMKIKGFIDLK